MTVRALLKQFVMVYVDDMYNSPMGKYRGMKMSHMIADSKTELLEMAEKIGVNLKWIQYEDTPQEHFDIAFVKRELAVKFGAKEITMRDLGRMTRQRMQDKKSAASEFDEPLDF